MKTLQDYPLGEWMDAADTCDGCGARYQVRIDYREYFGDEGHYGDITWRVKHAEGAVAIGPCLWSSDGEPEEHDTAGWTLAPRFITFNGQSYQLIAGRESRGPCIRCWRLVVTVPLILFVGDRYEACFCHECVVASGIVELMK